jgi:hypothetical protein
MAGCKPLSRKVRSPIYGEDSGSVFQSKDFLGVGSVHIQWLLA